jgi:hypothetical protein
VETPAVLGSRRDSGLGPDIVGAMAERTDATITDIDGSHLIVSQLRPSR